MAGLGSCLCLVPNTRRLLSLLRVVLPFRDPLHACGPMMATSLALKAAALLVAAVLSIAPTFGTMSKLWLACGLSFRLLLFHNIDRPTLEQTMRVNDLDLQLSPNAIVVTRSTVPTELRRQVLLIVFSCF
jgi:hypothetical protein